MPPPAARARFDGVRTRVARLHEHAFITPIRDRTVDDLIIRFLRGVATSAEEERLRAWREEAPANERHFEEIARVWTLTASAQSRAPRSPAPAGVDLVARASPGGGDRAAGAPRRGWRAGWVPAAAAAAAVILLGIGLGRIQYRAPAVANFAVTELATGPDETVTAMLDDGSVVRLAPESRLRVANRGGVREALLEGQAFFAVAPAPEPFVVRTPAGEALVLGTRFSVRAQEDSLQVVVVRGRVALTAGGGRVEVGAGEMSEANDGSSPRVERLDDPARYLMWMGGDLIFDATPLREVARAIERRHAIRVQVTDSALAERTVTAAFAQESVEDVFAVVCRAVRARCSVEASLVSIAP